MTRALWLTTTLSAATLAALLLSLVCKVTYTWLGPRGNEKLGLESGCLWWEAAPRPFPAPLGLLVHWNGRETSRAMSWWFVMEPPSTGFQLIQVPLWAPLLASSLPAAFLWRSHLKDRRRARAGACPTCGYDRRGLASGALCPECGAATAARSPPMSWPLRSAFPPPAQRSLRSALEPNDR